MANKRTLKRAVKSICEELFVECVAASLYSPENHREDAEALLTSIIKTEADFTARISIPEPGIAPKVYYDHLREQFNAQVADIVDQINNH